jgi:YARHG domain
MLNSLSGIVFVLMVMATLLAPQVCAGQQEEPLVISVAVPWLSSETSRRLIRSDELVPFTAQELRLLRNEIYARHGYVFNDQNLQNYFSSQPWYRPLGNNRLAVATLSPVERKNIATIRFREQAKVAAPDPQSAWMGRWPETSVYVIRPDDLLHLSTQDLRLMRNEIYARHGYVFNDQNLQNYFSSQPWYRPKGDNNSAIAELTPVERQNIEIIRSREEANVAAPYPQSASMGRWPETSIYVVRPDDLLHYSPQDLRLMRNEIYARHGYVFNDPFLQGYFSGQAWYRPRGNNSQAEAELNPVEKRNIDIIRSREEELNH